MSPSNSITREFHRLLDAETMDLSDHDAMLVRKGAALALGYAINAMAGTGLALKDATPDLIAVTPTVLADEHKY